MLDDCVKVDYTIIISLNLLEHLVVFVVMCNQSNHRFTTNMQRRLYGHATDVAVRPLDEEKAVQAAADLLGELFVFSVRLYLNSCLNLKL